MVRLAGQKKSINKIVSIGRRCSTLLDRGGGLYGVDKVIRTKEQADHSTVPAFGRLIDGAVTPHNSSRTACQATCKRC